MDLALDDPVLREWISPRYLEPSTILALRESALARPVAHYLVLDDFYNEDKLGQLIEKHPNLAFSEKQDRGTLGGGDLLPYDGAVHFATAGDYGSDLFFRQAWHDYCAFLVGSKLQDPGKTIVKLRYHRPDANGFWVHTDSADRSLVAICYFNRGWRVVDGGLLQLWRVDETLAPGIPEYGQPDPTARLDLLNTTRLRTNSPGGGWGGEHDWSWRDLVLVDQIVPSYNRLFLCDFQFNRAFHSVTPSNGRVRYGYVQWLVNLTWLAIGTQALIPICGIA